MLAAAGERCPFEIAFPFPFGTAKGAGLALAFGAAVVAAVKGLSFWDFIGLLLLDLARLNSSFESDSPSTSSVIAACAAVAFFLADLVMGALEDC